MGGDILPKAVRINFAAALPLQTTRFARAIFSQVAKGSVNPQEPSLDTFTGVALFNPNEQTAQLTIQVFDRDGNLVGQKTLSLGKNERLSDQIENLIPETSDVIRGHIVVVLHDAEWEGRPFDHPLYWRLRAAYYSKIH